MQKFNFICILFSLFNLNYTNCSSFYPLNDTSEDTLCKKNRKWNFENYLTATTKCIRYKTNENFCEKESKKILKYIWKHISKDKNELAIFMSSALHNTSCFKYMKVWNDESIYGCKGLLQIQGQKNYEILTNLSGINYLRCPQLLAKKTESAIRDTGLFWKSMMSGKSMTWEDSMDALDTKSWVKYCRCETKSVYPNAVSERYEIYELLKNLYN